MVPKLSVQKLQLLVCASFMIMMISSIFRRKCPQIDKRRALGQFSTFNSDSYKSHVKLSVVMPYPAMNRSTVVESMERIVEIGSPCAREEGSGRLTTSKIVQLILLVNTPVGEEDLRLLNIVSDILGPYGACFSRIKAVSANLTDEEDIYPAGPSNMFFKSFIDPGVRAANLDATHMFWMEHDVYPLRPHWLDALVAEAAKGDFWISGSVYMGDGLDTAAAVSYNWNWVGHINGNAVYSLQDPAFVEFLRLVIQYEPPNHFWKPFDVSIWRVLHAFPHTWPVYQKYRAKFVYSNFIHHWGFHVTSRDIEHSKSLPGVFLIHGANFSAGNLLLRPKPVPPDVVWTDRVPRSARLSIMIRSHAKDLMKAYTAARHAVALVPDALEVVVVVPKSDVQLFLTKFNTSAKTAGLPVIAEPTVLRNPVMQSKWSKLHADKYCKGELILHIDSKEVLNAELQLRDLLWMGKPILVYERFDTRLAEITGASARWASGTANALGSPIIHDFRSNSLHVYPRGLYEKARAHLRRMHGGLVTDFLSTRISEDGPNVNSSRLFSVYNYLGAFAWRHARGDVTLAPIDEDERRGLSMPPPTIRPPFF